LQSRDANAKKKQLESKRLGKLWRSMLRPYLDCSLKIGDS
jgi:hypothetical protein